MMHTVDLRKDESEKLQKLVSEMTRWAPEGTRQIQYLSHLPELRVQARRGRSSPVRMYWERDRCWAVFYERLFRMLLKLNVFYRISMLLEETLVCDVTPEALERALRETVSRGKTPVTLLLEQYRGGAPEPCDEALGSGVLGLITVGNVSDGLFDDDAFFYSDDRELNELFPMLAASEGLFTTALL